MTLDIYEKINYIVYERLIQLEKNHNRVCRTIIQNKKTEYNNIIEIEYHVISYLDREFMYSSNPKLLKYQYSASFDVINGEMEFKIVCNYIKFDGEVI